MRFKRCTGCQRRRHIERFGKSKRRGRQFYCRDCRRQYDADKYAALSEEERAKRRLLKDFKKQQIKDLIERIKQRGCVICAEEDRVCMDFHHLYDKKFTIGASAGQGISLSRVKAEIEKCVVICSNCHRKLHAGKIKLSNKIKPVRVE